MIIILSCWAYVVVKRIFVRIKIWEQAVDTVEFEAGPDDGSQRGTLVIIIVQDCTELNQFVVAGTSSNADVMPQCQW